MRNFTIVGIMLLMILPFSSYSQFRKYSNEFLNIGAGARGLAMGGAQVASARDETAGYWRSEVWAGMRPADNIP